MTQAYALAIKTTAPQPRYWSSVATVSTGSCVTRGYTLYETFLGSFLTLGESCGAAHVVFQIISSRTRRRGDPRCAGSSAEFPVEGNKYVSYGPKIPDQTTVEHNNFQSMRTTCRAYILFDCSSRALFQDSLEICAQCAQWCRKKRKICTKCAPGDMSEPGTVAQTPECGLNQGIQQNPEA
jgi:hypothetical protein